MTKKRFKEFDIEEARLLQRIEYANLTDKQYKARQRKRKKRLARLTPEQREEKRRKFREYQREYRRRRNDAASD